MALLEGQGYVSGARYKGSSDSRFALNTEAKLEYSLGKQTKAGVGEISQQTLEGHGLRLGPFKCAGQGYINRAWRLSYAGTFRALGREPGCCVGGAV
ncbi:hypothetical protein GCM10009425_17400 [Pseudomonas asuensis]|uniref:Uncharacterized protein n=1 Tax=Pseudomonas asuensis TaxID=1825787 RepID=A0ABQ2GQ40_9PSED|nr:hypothetical protein GCM10009425_17400 [Pseudomonas asuensis]